MKTPEFIVREMLLTEKGSRQTETHNQYQFKVHPDANKIEIKQAVEELFKVKVTHVNTLNRFGKKKRERTMNFGTTAGWKKAVVTLKAGDTIDLA